MGTKRTRQNAGFPSPASSDLMDDIIMQQLKAAATMDLSAIFNDTSISPAIKVILQQQQAANSALFKFLTQQQATEDPAEKKERERSLVIIGVPESTHALPSERHKADVAVVTSLFDQLGIEPTPVVYRLGRHANPAIKGSRLIKCILPAKHFQHMVLGAWKRCRTDIRQQPEFKNMIIRPSLTLEQRMKEREERNLRRTNANMECSQRLKVC
uniref:Uncharacterized protein n=1 Tax=Meloidogyne floridensis TaxID=298350 RepID=A0A915P2K8_9BILA